MSEEIQKLLMEIEHLKKELKKKDELLKSMHRDDSDDQEEDYGEWGDTLEKISL